MVLQVLPLLLPAELSAQTMTRLARAKQKMNVLGEKPKSNETKNETKAATMMSSQPSTPIRQRPQRLGGDAPFRDDPVRFCLCVCLFKEQTRRHPISNTTLFLSSLTLCSWPHRVFPVIPSVAWELFPKRTRMEH